MFGTPSMLTTSPKLRFFLLEYICIINPNILKQKFMFFAKACYASVLFYYF